MALLETHGLSKSFGALTAVNRVSLAIEAGTLHSIIGPNGAGKTTLFNLLTGTFAPSSGRICLDGADITGTPAHRIAHLGLARSFQRTNLFPAFSLLDNVWVAAFACSPSWRGLIWRPSERYPELLARARQGTWASRKSRASWRAKSRTASSASSSWRSPSPRSRACCCSTSPPRASPRRRRGGW
jgi:branched-chain amino acid transport system ATP-binding protein